MKKLSDYAKEHGVCYRTAYNHFHAGLIKGAYQLDTKTIVIPDDYTASFTKAEYIITYARVSSSENKKNLETQSERLISFCNARGWVVAESVKEVGSGLNDSRKKLTKILTEGKATKIVVEHKDRLSRFGSKYIEMLCKQFGCEIVYINQSESEKEDLVQDFVNIITCFCVKLYGQRRTKRKTEKLIKMLQNEEK